MDWLLDILGLNKGKATINAAEQNKKALSGLDTRLNGIIDSTSAEQQGYLKDSLGLASMGPNAKGILGDIYGLNGAEGSASARGMFQAAPGYQYSVDQGEQAIMRNASALGRTQSGNTEIDLMRHGVGMADQGWNDWISGITSGIDRQIGAQGDLASQAGQVGATRLGVAGDIGSGMMAANNQVASGKEAGQGSLWDFLGNAAGVAGSFMGMGGFGGGGGGVGKGATGANTFANSRGSYGIPGYGGGF